MMQSAMNKFLMVYFEIHIFEQTVFHSQVIVTANKINSKIFFPFSCTNPSFKIKHKIQTTNINKLFLLSPSQHFFASDFCSPK